jgi:hypothetical protein
MKKLSKKFYIQLLIAVLVVIFGSLIWSKPRLEVRDVKVRNSADIEAQSVSSIQKNNELEAKPQVMKLNNFITMIAGSTNVQLVMTPHQTIYEILNNPENAGKISFSGKDYTTLGFFVTDIGDLHSGNGKNLLYYVNGVEAPFGISIYTPQVGDYIEWKLK